MTVTSFPGEELRVQRESLGLSITKVSHMIHVPLPHLIALEDGNIDALPELTYSIGFLRTYCEFLGLPCDPYIAQLRLAMNPPQTRTRFLPKSLDVGETQPAWVADFITWGTICGMVVLGWITFNTIVKPFADRPDTRVEAGTSAITPPVHFEEYTDR